MAKKDEFTKEELQLLILGLVNIPMNGITIANMAEAQKQFDKIAALRTRLLAMMEPESKKPLP